MRTTRWSITPPHDAAKDLASRLKISPVTAQILLSRGLSLDDDCRQFLSPSLKSLHDPASLPGVPQAATRIAKAIRDGQPIAIYGDYDVDGITATSILYHALTQLGAKVRTYVPHRIEEGYGLNSDALKKLIDEGAKLLLTVDCGITALDPAQLAADRNVDLIITDHHEWKVDDAGNPQLPTAHTLVHPRLPPTQPAQQTGLAASAASYPNPHLCGAGVAFKLAWGIGQAIHGPKVADHFRQLLVEMTALAALGTIADVVPLIGENRVLASFGLTCLTHSKLTGINALLASANLVGDKLDAFHVGFLLAPRLNAAGRMGHAELAVEMLTTASAERATEIATYLESQNRDRQATEKQTLTEVLAQISQLGDDQDCCHGILLSGPWHPGVIGIVASRIVDRLHRPTVLISTSEDLGGVGSGSGRSIPGFHLAQALCACTDLLLSHGGHEMAAGLKVSPTNIPALRDRFQSHAKETLSPEHLTPTLKLDAEIGFANITEPLVHELSKLGPFGNANRRPLLACTNVEIALPPRRVGKTGDHLQLTLRQSNKTMKGIAFNKGPLAETLQVGQRISLAVEPSLNEWNGRTTVEIQIKDLRPA